MSVTAQHPVLPGTLESPVSPISAPSPGHSRTRSNLPDSLGTPPIPPPRTSSHQRGHHNNSGARSGNSSAERVAGSRPAKHRVDDGIDRGESRRKGFQTPESPPGPSSEIEPLEQPPATPNRSDTALESAATHSSLVKESSTIINQVVITDPVIDLERENARQLEAQPSPPIGLTPVTGLGLVGSDGVDDGTRSGGSSRSRNDYSSNSSRRKETSFGQYILGQTIGEGEFGKVKLGWKRDGSIQVAIKLIRRESLGSNPNRLPKIYREISILRDLSHPYIVRLHEMVETDRHIGIIMEYASGGELFDHILKNRYLKDHAARRLFAQLVSGVGYLHKKGIVHRDLKLENLLLDRNRNIIITDFGFANKFNPNDELGDEIEFNLTNKEFVRRNRLDRTDTEGIRRGDLMQTSCGSPCYAAPELVVSDSLYTGRKVDVWSCGVILYAMLAGYLPFDDDPENPEGDNINLLYKYIVTTPLTFPEYVTPHARDLLRRILVPDPRKRADLFEVARHSWLSEYSHIVSHITSTTTNLSDIATTTVPTEDTPEGAPLMRSASVREPQKSYQNSVPPIGGLTHQQGKIGQDDQAEKPRPHRDAKRRTVQVEYVEPHSRSTRGAASGQNVSPSVSSPPGTSRARARSGSRGPVDPPQSQSQSPSLAVSQVKTPPKDSLIESGSRSPYTKVPSIGQDTVPSPGIPPRSMSESTFAGAQSQSNRPNTGHSTTSLNAGRLPSRGSYGQPVAPTVAATNAQGRLAQPKNGKQYVISSPIPQDPAIMSIGRPSTQQLPAKFIPTPFQEPPKTHKRSSTVSSISEKVFGKSGSIFGSARPKSSKRYPPTSMKDPYSADDSRVSVDSRRSMSYGFNRRQGDSGPESRPRRFSLLPASLSFKGFTSGAREQQSQSEPQMSQIQDFGSPIHNHGQKRPSTGPTVLNRTTGYGTYGDLTAGQDASNQAPEVQTEEMNYEAQIDRQFAALDETQHSFQFDPFSSQPLDRGLPQNDSHQQFNDQYAGTYPEELNATLDDRQPRQSMQSGRPPRGSVLQKNNRKFTDAYEYGDTSHSGSSGPARKVMDFFRRRGKARAGDDR
ncbi:hypothetical protein Egran_03563 [Elaphomyces granulatus]|uniref:non-specific serine/threonine protein kinase n=1 Tax=Elaphomyces granulatus TaxID=519963 RepID=A0A232LX65_9EURO|nr:hypothetical protein Egran_03563 [Elaphomyces granulatus]